QYSQFCYEIPFMPGQTQYMDTPVTPTSAFAGAGYNNPDCSYPDATPAVSEVDGDGIGPWVNAAGHTLTIHALGDQMVPNNAYVGPSGTTAPYNQKTIRRHYGFGATTGSVSIGGVTATPGSWNDSQIVVTVPSGVPACDVQQQQVYGGSAAQCGELVITTAATTVGTGTVSGVTITNPGTGYTGRPAVAFAGPTCTINGTTCVRATQGNSGTAGVFTDVVSVVMSNPGANYTATPTATFSLPLCTINTTTCVRATGTANASPRQTFAARRSIDTVTVTIGGKAPTHVAPTHSIQAAIDVASPGDLLMIDPLTQATATTAAVPAIHQELLLMWKPVRLQGVGAVSSVLNANTHPAGK